MATKSTRMPSLESTIALVASSDSDSEMVLDSAPLLSLGLPSSNCFEGLLLYPGDVFTIHPTARAFRRSDREQQILTKDIVSRGQLNAGIYRELDDGSPEVLDGVTRLDIVFRMKRPFACRKLTAQELNGRTIERFIHDVNTTAGAGRHLNDNQRAIAVVECLGDELFHAMKEDARKRQLSGKPLTDSEKVSAAVQLGRDANVTSARVQKVLDLRTANGDKVLFDAVWEGTIAMSIAVQIAKEKDTDLRNALVAKVKVGDKAGIKNLLNGPARRYDKNGVSIPNEVAPAFDKAAPVKKAVAQIREAMNSLSELDIEAKLVESLQAIASEVDLDVFHLMCEWCDTKGILSDDRKCPACHGRRFLTRREFEAAKKLEMEKLLTAK